MSKFDDIVNSQSVLGKEIEQFIISVGKDPVARRTLDYYKKKLQKLRNSFSVFKQTHNELVSLGQGADHQYFLSKYYDQVEAGVELLSEKFNKNISRLEREAQEAQNLNPVPTASEEDERPPQNPVPTSQPKIHDTKPSAHEFSFDPFEHKNEIDERLQRLQNQQSATIKATVHLVEQTRIRLLEQQSKQYYQVKMDTINRYWSTISELNFLIWELTDAESEYDMGEYYRVEEMVHDTVIKISEQLAGLSNYHVTHPQQTQVKLPTITVPSFDGDYMKWQQFNDVYTQMIHNTGLSSSDKMFYLNSNLSGEARALIQHLPISNENYEVAWRILTNRYNNKRVLCTALLNKLLNQPNFQVESASAIRSLHDVTLECTLGLKTLDVAVESWDVLLLHLLIKKVDKTTHSLYEQSISIPNELQTLDHFLDFLELRFQSLNALGYTSQHNTTSKISQNQKHNNSKLSVSGVATHTTCKVCREDHAVYLCPTFLKMSVHDRLKKLKEVKLCINCLKDGHFSSSCTARDCKVCNRKHNTLVHGAFENANTLRSKPNGQQASRNQNSTSNNSQPSTGQAIVGYGVGKASHVFLATAVVQVSDVYGNFIECRALLDSGSQVNLITKQLTKRLGLRCIKSDSQLTGIGGSKQSIDKYATIRINSKISSYSRAVDVLVLDSIIDDQPNYNLNSSMFDIPDNIKLADPDFCHRRGIDILLGAELYSEIMMIGQIASKKKNPPLQNTVFGWVVMGRATNAKAGVPCCGATTLEEQLQRFWELDEVQGPETSWSSTERQCEELFDTTTMRDDSGKFVVRLLFKENTMLLGSSHELAKRRFFALERKLQKHPQLKEDYIQFMKEYEQQGHMESVAQTILTKPHYFIPHHCVLKPGSTTTKLRVVFDASCKTSSNVSLNQLLHKGPKIQQDIFDVLIRFRQHRYVFTGDIEKMYRQILVAEQDTCFQLIWWRDDPTKSLNVYKLKTVTYGTTSAPYTAIKCLQTLGAEINDQFPLAAKMVTTDFYVDDLMAGDDNLQTAIQMQMQVKMLLNTAGFKLRKWCANNKALLENVPLEDIEHKLDITENGDPVKTLGITWDPICDVITIKTAWKDQKRVTKRMVLADVAHIFDPIGLVSPVIIVAKIFMQELWKQKFDWDAALPLHLHTKWTAFRSGLKHLDQIRVPRLTKGSNPGTTQLHIFSDASERAFGAAIYMRSVNDNNVIETKLLCSKSRVSPSKITTIPRLELQAAKLAAELCHRVNSIVQFKEENIFFWTDSEIVLHWIHAESSSFKTFVANRISYIQQRSVQSQWRHVLSEDNPADYISRGIHPERLQSMDMWFNGPSFLKHSSPCWPRIFSAKAHDDNERRILKSVLVIENTVKSFVFQIDHKNSFSFVVRTTAYVLRFIASTRNLGPKNYGFLLVAEVQDAFIRIIKLVQELFFEHEIKVLGKNKELERNNRLSTLTPFVDAKGVLRVGGRIEAANLSFDAKHPILLPADHVFTTLIMTEIHVQHHHIGPQALLALTRQRFWPINGKRIASRIVHRCMQCFKTHPQTLVQRMGNPPAVRIQSSRPFLNTGVDFAGPVMTHFKIRGKRPQKSYIAVFCCMATKAMHLELVSDLSAEGFIGALRRFWSRRGRCQSMMSDNATNFVGGSNQLQEIYEMLNSTASTKKIHSECLNKGIEFKFIPPRAPHFGGLWESAVKSIKRLLYRTMGAASLTFEEMSTLTVEIEAILNSRPITPVSTNANDLMALTPAHFLIGDQLTTIVDPELETKNINNITRWKLVNYIKNEFWRRWQTEYISTLQQRFKWKSKCQNVEPGLMVLIKEDNLPPSQWRLGRVENTYKGPDSLIRVVDVRTAYGTFKRPIHKLCPLPLEKDEETNNPEGKHSRESVRKRAGLKLSSIATLLLLLCIGPIQTNCNNIPLVEITAFDSMPGIYFESLGMANLINNEWHLVVYYELQNYWTELRGFELGVRKLRLLCNQMKNGTYCENILTLFEHNVRDIQVYNEVIVNADAGHLRSKRGAFDIVGTVANKLFGVLDVEYADKMATTIRTIGRNEKALSNLLNNHTLIMETTANVLKRTQDQVNQQFAKFDKHLNEIKLKVDQVDTYFKQQEIHHMFASLAVQTLLVMGNYQKVQNNIITVLTESHQGKVNPLLITPVQLRNSLFTIKDNLSPSLKLPYFSATQMDVSNIYNLLHVQARVTEENIIFRMQLPLASNNQFETFRLIPIPVKVNEFFYTIKPSSFYLIVSLHRDLFYPLSEAEAASCIKVGSDNMYCKQSHPVYNKLSTMSHCEMALLNHKGIQPSCTIIKSKGGPEWVQLFNPNHWIYSLNKNTTVNIVCGEHATVRTLVGVGVLKLSTNCVLKQDTLTITSHNIHPSQLRTSFVPTVNITSIISTSNGNGTSTFTGRVKYETPKINMDETRKLEDQIKDIKSRPADLEELNAYDVHHFAVGYLGLSLGIAVAAFLIWSKCRRPVNRVPVPMPRRLSLLQEPQFNFNVDESIVV